MSRDSILRKRSFELSVRVVNVFRKMPSPGPVDFIIRQVMRAATSVAAQIREAEFAESKKDFVHKLYIGLKEANETLFWLELSSETNIITKDIFESLYSESVEIVKMLTSSVKTSRDALKNGPNDKSAN